ncbi:MAG TPA: hypothetical protein ENJ22_01805 [Gammaproteobacteria bacterium]|nr:hypothetical protein [Gammaproteobacteria bacterium]
MPVRSPWIHAAARYLLCLAVLAWLPPADAGDDRFARDVAAMREVYLQATDGEKRAVRRAIQASRRLERKYRNHPLALAYKGGALALRGIDAYKRPLDRMRETEEGLVILDRALRILEKWQGDDLEATEARLVTAYVFLNLPDSVFHRLRQGEHLVELLLRHPGFDGLPRGMRAAIYFAAATAADKRKDAARRRRYLELTVKTDPEGKNGKEARALLDAAKD